MHTGNNHQLSEVLIRVRTGPFDLIITSEPDQSLRIDCAGRWLSLRQGSSFYRRLMNGSVVRYRHMRDEPQPVEASESVHGLARELAGQFVDDLRQDSPEVELRGSLTDRERIIDRLECVRAWTEQRWIEWSAQFEAVYPEPVVILPPDRYQDLVIQPALGCPNGACSFCAFYQDRSFSILSDAEFERHLEGIQTLLGPSMGLRDGIFLGSANALAIPQPTLIDRLRRIAEQLGPRKRQVAAFWDPDHSPRRTAADWEDLKAQGLSAVYAGLETGLPALRKKLGKSDRIEDFKEALRVPRQMDMRLGIIVLVGAGGEAFRAAHRTATVQMLESLSWTRSDWIYLSPLSGGLPQDALQEELENFTRTLRNSVPARVAPYHINRFCYFA